MMQKFAGWLTHHTKLVLTTALLLLIPCSVGYFNTFVNYDILSYLPEELDSTQGQIVLDETFHNAASSMLIVKGMPEKDVAALKEQVKAVPGVNDVVWVDDITDISIPKEILPDMLKNVFYSKDGSSTMMLVKYDGSGASEETMNAIQQIRGLAGKQCFLSGMSVIVKDTKDLVDQEMPIYVLLAVLLAAAAMLLSMESWFLPVVFLMGIGLAIVYNMGTNFFLGQISYVTKAIAAILQLGVTMDYSIFLLDRYNEEKEKCSDRRDAMAHAVTQTFVSLSGSSLTTVFGFLALCFMRLTLGRDIGIVMAKGVILGVLTVVIILPALILSFDKLINRFRHRTLIPKFDRLNHFLVRHRWVFAIAGLLLFFPAYYAQSNPPVYYNLDRSLPQDLPSIVSLNTMKEDFNMSSTHFILVDDSLPASELKEMSTRIEKLDGIENVLSYNAIVGPVIPDSFIPGDIREMCKKDGWQMLMVNSAYRAADDAENRQIEEINAIVKSYDPNAMVTGEGAMTKDLIDVAKVDFVVTNVISIAAIFLIVAVCFKSITVPVILVACIELAIFINLGIPYLTGTVIPFITPTVIGCVQLGATVDYAILLATRFREELRTGKSRPDALITAANAADRSIVSSALVLFSATMGVFLISKIEIIQNICSMLARGSIISALVIIFILTPVLYVTEGVISKTTIGWRKEKNKKQAKSGRAAENTEPLPAGIQ